MPSNSGSHPDGGGKGLYKLAPVYEPKSWNRAPLNKTVSYQHHLEARGRILGDQDERESRDCPIPLMTFFHGAPPDSRNAGHPEFNPKLATEGVNRRYRRCRASSGKRVTVRTKKVAIFADWRT